MTNIEEGSVVKCAFCRKDVKVDSVVEYEGETAYNLSCFHRNTYCPTCNQMAKDDSERIKEIVRLCETCDGVSEAEFR
jgi:hypothetical protein